MERVVPILVVLAALAVVALPAAAESGGAEAAIGPADVLGADASGAKKFRKHRRPAQFGSSMGNVEDFNGFGCGSGTGGALLMMNDPDADAARYFILSNNHVLGITNSAKVGDLISQPGNIDVDPVCVPDEADIVGTFSGYKRIRFGGKKRNKADMALAEADTGSVSTDGKQIKIGVPGNDWVEPFLFQAVQKDGRTSGHTVGEVIDVSASVRVNYATGDDPIFPETKRALFIKQIIIASTNRRSFALSGDSGAVVYEKVKSCPRAVGLLFAANDVLAAANPMKIVMALAGRIKPRGAKELAGCDPAPAAQEAATPVIAQRLVRRAVRIKERWAASLMDLPGVVGVGVGAPSLEERGEVVIRVYIDRPAEEVLGQVPAAIDGVRTVLIPGGSFVAF